MRLSSGSSAAPADLAAAAALYAAVIARQPDVRGHSPAGGSMDIRLLTHLTFGSRAGRIVRSLAHLLLCGGHGDGRSEWNAASGFSQA